MLKRGRKPYPYTKQAVCIRLREEVITALDEIAENQYLSKDFERVRSEFIEQAVIKDLKKYYSDVLTIKPWLKK